MAVDRNELRNYGTVLSDEASARSLPHAFGVDGICDALQKALMGDAPRAAVLVGPSGAGKTAIVQELAYRLLSPADEGQDWTILRLAPSDFLIGTRYIGEWETRVATFRALDSATAAKIAKRELTRVLERSGIARRRILVDVDPGVLALLLLEGYSAAFGARPLKRTVERMVLLPVARAIASGAAPPNSVLRLLVRGDQVEVEISLPEQEGESAGREEPKPTTARFSRALALLETLKDQVRSLRVKAEPVSARKSELLATSVRPGFWDTPDAARQTMDEIYRLDSVLAALDAIEKAVAEESEPARQESYSSRDSQKLEQRIGRHDRFLV